MPRYPFAEWMVEQLRLTLFPVPGVAGMNPEAWWEAVAGAQPEEVSGNLRTGLRTVAGAFRTGKLILTVAPQRIDWFFVPPDLDPAAGLPGDFRFVGTMTDSLEVFSNVAEQWLGRNDTPDLVRIAFGLVTLHPEEDRHGGYTRLPAYLPVEINPDSSDLMFQLNLPTDSRTGIDGLRINRLSKWSVMGLAPVNFQIQGNAVAAGVGQFFAYALRVELDMNTAAEFRGALPRERRLDIYRELVAFARNVLTDGLRG